MSIFRFFRILQIFNSRYNSGKSEKNSFWKYKRLAKECRQTYSTKNHFNPHGVQQNPYAHKLPRCASRAGGGMDDDNLIATTLFIFKLIDKQGEDLLLCIKNLTRTFLLVVPFLRLHYACEL